jgi:hypothetical protein
MSPKPVRVVAMFVIVLALVLVLLGGGELAAAPPSLPAVRATVTWREVPLGLAVERIAQQAQRPLIVDRRVDRSAPLNFTAKEEPLDLLLAKVLAPLELGYGEVDGLLYVGPEATAWELRTLWEQSQQRAAKAPAALRTVLVARTTLNWPRLTEPRKLIVELCEERRVELKNSDSLPHDLWPAGSLPAISFAKQLTLLLAGFELDWQVADSGQAIEIVPLVHPTQFERAYARERIDAAAARRLAAKQPEAKVRLNRQEVLVTGSRALHQQLNETLHDN